MSSPGQASAAVRRIIEKALARFRLPADRIDDQLPGRTLPPGGPDGDGYPPAPHGASHAGDGSDPLPLASTSVAGIVELATSAETTAGLAVQASDTRLSDARTPTGPAGGDLSGTYPNPTVAQLNGQLPAYYRDRANHTGTQLSATISDFDTQVRTNRLDQLAAPTASLNLNSQRITNLADPSSAQDAANKAYVDAVATGLRDFKESARAATTGNVTLAGGAPSTVDGVALATGNRVLVRAQSAGAENGIYTVQTLGTGSNGTWTRATDADSSAEVTAGMFLFVTEGTTYGDTGWVLATNDAITLGSTSLTFAQFGSGSLGGSGTADQFAYFSSATVLASSSQLVRDSGLIAIGLNDASDDTILFPLSLRRTTSGTPDSGIGTGLEWCAETSTTPNARLASLEFYWIDETHASRLSYGALYLQSGDDPLLIMGLQDSSVASFVPFVASNEYDDTATSVLRGVLNGGTAANSSAKTIASLERQGGTPAAGYGGRTLYRLENGTTVRDAGGLGAGWSTVADATRTSYVFVETVNNAGSLTERARVTGPGALWVGVTSGGLSGAGDGEFAGQLKAGNTTLLLGANSLVLNKGLTIGNNQAGTLTFSAASKTLTVANSLTLAGTDGKTLTLNENLTLAGATGKSLTLTNSLVVSGNDGTLAFSAASKTLTVAQSLTLDGASGKSLTLTNSLTVSGNDGTLSFGAASKTLTISQSLTLTGTSGKTLTLTNSLTVSGNDGTLSFGAASKTLTVNQSLTLDGTSGKALTLTGSLTVGADLTINGGGTITTARRARVTHNTTQSIPNNVAAGTVLAFNTERQDDGSFHDTVTNNSRLTAPVSGWYSIGAQIGFAANTTGLRNAVIRLNGTTDLITAQDSPPAAGKAWLNPVTEYFLTAGDYVEVYVFQNSGGALNVDNVANTSPEFWISLVN